MSISILELFLIIAGGLVLLYAAAWVASRAFFNSKADYNRKLLQQLEESKDVEKKG